GLLVRGAAARGGHELGAWRAIGRTRLLAQRRRAQETLQSRLVDRRRCMRRPGDGCEEAAGAGRVVKYRSLHCRGHRREGTLAGGGGTSLRAGHLQRLGDSHAIDETPLLQSLELSLRKRVAG